MLFGETVLIIAACQRTIVARRRLVAVALNGEEPISAVRAVDHYVAVSLFLNVHIPVVSPATTQRTQFIARVNRLTIHTAEDQRNAWGRGIHINTAGEVRVGA